MNQPTEREACEWKQQDAWDNSANWDTSCGNIFTLTEGNPTNNDMKFCCYCGKPLKDTPAEDFNDD